MYLFDFKQKSVALTNYPPLSANTPRFFRGFFLNCERIARETDRRRFVSHAHGIFRR